MSQSEFDFFSDGPLAQIPEQELSLMSAPMEGIMDDADSSRPIVPTALPASIFASDSDAQVQVDHPTLDKDDRALVLSGSLNHVISQSASFREAHPCRQETPLFGSGTSQLVPTHVSALPQPRLAMSTPPVTTSRGLLEWRNDCLQLSERAVRIRGRLLQILRDDREDCVLEALAGHDDASITEGIDLVVAGMLEHDTHLREHAERLQTAINLLVTRRGLHIVQHARFQTLLHRSEVTRRSPDPKASYQEIIQRVWGKDYQSLLGIKESVELAKPLASLAQYSETLHQPPEQIRKYLEFYKEKRLAKPAKGNGRRHTVTGEDIRDVNRDFCRIVSNTHHDYSASVVIEAQSRFADADESALERFPSEEILAPNSQVVKPTRLFQPDVLTSKALPVLDSQTSESPAGSDAPQKDRSVDIAAKQPKVLLQQYHSEVSFAAQHRDQYVAVPASHYRFQVPRGHPLLASLDLTAWRMAANIHGYTWDGSFRYLYEPGHKYKIWHSQLIFYYSDDHQTYNPTRYGGSLIIAPPLRNRDASNALWRALSALTSRGTGLHPFHRIVECDSSEEVIRQQARGNNVVIRDQDSRADYPHCKINLGRALEDLGIDAEQQLQWVDQCGDSYSSTINEMVADYTPDNPTFDSPGRTFLDTERSGLTPSFEATFGRPSARIAARRNELDPEPWTNDDIGKDEERAMFAAENLRPIFNSDKRTSAEGITRQEHIGICVPPGRKMPTSPAVSPDIVPDSQEDVQELERARILDMAKAFENKAVFTAGGYFDTLECAPHGACVWMKMHYGHAILFLAYEECDPDDTVISKEIFPGDVFALQSGQRYAVYYARCTLITQGYFYHPYLMLTQSRDYNPREFSNPFKKPDIEGSLLIMRKDAGSCVTGGVQPIFHYYMLALCDLLLSKDEDTVTDLGLECNATRIQLLVEMHGYLCSTIFEYCRSVFDEFGFDARNPSAECQSDEATDMMLVLRHCTMMQACLTRRMNLSGPHNYYIDKASSPPRSSPGRRTRQWSSTPAASYGGTEDE